MSHSTKERITTEFQKAKSAERERAERIQEIVQEAFSKTLAEVKDGTGEIRGIFQENLSEILARVNKIENENDEAAQKTPGLRSKAIVIAVSKALKNRLLPYLRQAYTDVQHQYATMNNHEVNRDINGAEIERNRYERLKQRLETFAAWYNQLKAQSQTVEPSVVEYKQAEFENKMGEAGATVAQRERQVKQQLQQWLQTATAKR
jgi:hypothetical protein